MTQMTTLNVVSKKIIKANPSAVNVPNNEAATPFEMAKDLGYSKIADMLTKYGADR